MVLCWYNYPHKGERILALSDESLGKAKVIIVNDFDLTSSIGIMFKDYEDAIRGYGSLFSLAYSWRYPKMYYPGRLVPPILFSRYSLEKYGMTNLPDIGGVISSRFPSVFYFQFIRDLKVISKDAVIHYSNSRIFPFVFNDRSVITMNDLIYLRTKRFRESMIKLHLIRTTKIYRKFKNVIAVSHVTKKELIDFGFEGHIEVIYQPVPKYFRNLEVDRIELRKKLNLPIDKILLLSVSTNRPGKNLKALRDMMHLMDDRYKLVRVGVPFCDSITFRGVSNETLNEIYNACDVLVFPSTEEGFGRPVTEAFTVGLPVVASDIEVMQEVCGDAAILITPTPSELKRGVLEILGNKDEFIVKGMVRSELFSFSNFSNRLKEYYSGI